jgi:fatty-acyl-CoA synthase
MKRPSTALAPRNIAPAQFLRDSLRTAYQRYSDRVALASGSWSVTYGELGERSFRMAQLLDEMGLAPGEAVGVVVRDIESLVTLRFGTFERGTPLFTLSPTLAGGHDLEMLRWVQPEVVFYDPRLDTELGARLARELPGANVVSTGPQGELEGLLSGVTPCPSSHAIPEQRLSGIGFSSGTTGPPKGLVTTFGALAQCCRRFLEVMDRLGLDRPLPFLNAVPIQGAGGGMLPPALSRGMTVHVPAYWDARAAADLIEGEAIEGLFATPSMIIDLLELLEIERWDFSALRAVIYGSAIMPSPKLEEAVRRLGPIFLQGYGLAEVLPPLSVLWPEEHGSTDRPADRTVLSSAGHPWPGVDLRVVDEKGRTLEPGQVGEILVDSDTVTPGYWEDPLRTRRARRGRWWRTLDVGFFDQEGRLHILSRQADVLRHEGRALYPRDIEEVCHEHRAVKEACAVAAPDGALVVALSLRMAFHDSPDSVVGELADRLADRFSIPPPRIEVVPEVPRSQLGKILHREVRESLAYASPPGARESRPASPRELS